MKIKNILLKNKLIWEINSFFKSKQVETKYENIKKEYENKKIEKTFKELIEKKGWENFSFFQDTRIFYIGTDYLQDFGGFNQALEKKFSVKFFYKENGEYGQYSRGNAPAKNLYRIENLLEKYLKEENWVPDILMMQSFGFNIDNEKILELKEKYGFKIINIGMDERLSYRLEKINGKEQGIAGLNEIVDLVLVTTPECVEWYMKDNIPAIYFPLASNEEIYYPIENKEKKYDVGFIGRKYGIREEIVNFLIKNGIDVKAYGPGWESGTLDVSDNNEFYNSCKIVLGTGNIGYSKKLMNPKLRDFEVPLTGTLYITNYSKELSELFVEDKEIVLYKSKKELLKKVNYYLKNIKEREKIGKNGYIKAIREHTYEVRLEKKLKNDISLE
jgi:hypothetical protein